MLLLLLRMDVFTYGLILPEAYDMKYMNENSEIINTSHKIFADLSVVFLHLFDNLSSLRRL